MGLFMDKCGGHADPYHFHTDMVCHYNVTVGLRNRLL